jgi:hypothetical protein
MIAHDAQGVRHSYGSTFMRYANRFFIGIIATTVMGFPAYPQDDADQSLRLYGVHIHVTKPPTESWTGNGVYLGSGLVITAAHLIGAEPWFKIQVEIGGQALPANVLKRGQFHDVDLTLLSVDEAQLPVSLRLRRLTLCQQPAWPGEDVVVAVPEEVARSHIILPALLPRDLAPKYRTAISDVATTGNSGSGVFDANRKCLLGIISAKIQEFRTRQVNGHAERESHDVAKYFVPAGTIAEFIPPENHF